MLKRQEGNPATTCVPGSPCDAQWSYDARDRLLRHQQRAGTATTYTLDEPAQQQGDTAIRAGNVTTEDDGAQRRVRRYLANQLTELAINGTTTAKYWYDPLGNLDCVTTAAGSQGDCSPSDGAGASANLLVDHAYDHLDRLGLCGREAFREQWRANKLFFWDMPAEDALKLAWESGTQAIREDWEAGRKTQAAGRGVTAVLSAVLGGKGATTLGRRAGRLTRPGRLATKSGSVLNKVGREYPSVLDPRTGAPIPYPGGGLSKVPVSEQVAWGAKERGAYIKEWYDRGYATPEGGWSGYDVHHIRPREYGGTNDFGNLVPVPRTVHQQEFNTWWQHY